ncbi:MAG TPA: tetratricopeptide repeat protein [Bradyrhizobium sp.]|uniref:tetratricopeptide repeat protein n=1 Tax=Bradyrhizobium sp. TaxID=376 RepID=UPI002D80CC44|nr:tetratricopeptide repeat protein [Bradyrhizobium sp.]HET7888633.1 tetratricopeptide repeat protein [Bradyrhizobium sp.]
MARMAAAGFWSRLRSLAPPLPRGLLPASRAAAAILAGALAVLAFSAPARAADAVKAEATLSSSGGYARLVVKFAEDVGSEVVTAGSIMVIRFERPVDVSVDGVANAVPDYIGSARRDPDGSAIRLSLSRKVTVNTMTAGERLFVDLLPDSWKGPPPSLPQEVVRELAERARAAERELRQQRAMSEAKKRPPVRVRTSVQPTFVRFVFEMPDGVGVSSVLNEQRLKLLFTKALTFDLADAKLSLPPNVLAITQKIEGETAVVELTMLGDVDVHSFREDKNYVIDVAYQQADKPQVLPQVSDAPPAPSRTAEKPAPAAKSSDAKSSDGKSSSAEKSASTEVAPPSETMQTMAAAPAAPMAKLPAAAENPPASDKPATMERMAAAPQPPAPAESSAASTVPETAEPAPKIAPNAAMPAKADEAPASEAAVKKPAAAPAMASPETKAQLAHSDVSAIRDGGGLHLTFSLPPGTPAALFRRADTLWLMLDSKKPIDVEPIRGQGGAAVTDISVVPQERGQAVRFRLNRPQLPSLAGEDLATGTNWTVTFADTVQTPSQALSAIRNIADPSLANVTVPMQGAGMLHRFTDPDAGDTLFVVTARPPARGFIKRQDFVELSLLESIHGVAIRPNSDDVTADVGPDKVILGKPGGLTLSPADSGAERAPTAVRPIFDLGEWRKNRDANFNARADALIEAAGAAASGNLEQRVSAQLDLARFYMARAMYPETVGVLNLALADSKVGAEDPAVLIVHALANILMGRPERALKDLASPAIGTNYDSQLWKAMASARQNKWADAREKFKSAEFAITSLPVDLQRIVIAEALHASLEVKDYPGAAKRASELDVIGIAPEQAAAVGVLRGRLAEGLGHEKDALDEYKRAAASPDRPSAAEAKLLQIALQQKRNEITQEDSLRELETLSVIWRGDAIEVQTLEMLAKIYADIGRFSESFAAVRTANLLAPNLEVARQGQDAASALFAQLFLGPKGDDLPAIDALGMFYEYRDLTPIGRRGDEMIRRLADRLVAVDLLDQAAELLQYQVDKRLEGAARAQVAARLAMVYLTARKPERAIIALRSTRIADLSGELRQQRLLLEARAQSDVGRHELALDIISNLTGREAIRLRSDIYWAARKWRESAEQIELYYADRWRDFKPLTAAEKSDVIRAVVGYALAEDAIGLTRFREKYLPLMSGEADRTAFEIASKPVGSTGADFAAIAKMAASVDTLDGFLREMRTRYPDATARAITPPGTAKADPTPTGSLPAIIGTRASIPKFASGRGGL